MITQAILTVSGLLAAGGVTFATALVGAILDVRGTGCTASVDGYSAVVISRDWISFGDPWLLRLDSEGRLVHAGIVGPFRGASREMESGGLVEELPDGSVLVAVHSEPRATGLDADACVFRLDPDGALAWNTVLGRDDDGVYRMTGLAAFEDGSFVAAGSTGCEDETPFAGIFDPEGRPAGELEIGNSLYVEIGTASRLPVAGLPSPGLDHRLRGVPGPGGGEDLGITRSRCDAPRARGPVDPGLPLALGLRGLACLPGSRDSRRERMDRALHRAAVRLARRVSCLGRVRDGEQQKGSASLNALHGGME